METSADVLRMFNGEMSCRPGSQHPAPGPGYQIQTSAWAPPPGPEGAGLRNTGPFPGRLPDPGLRGSPWLPKLEPGYSQSHSRAGGGRLHVKIMLTTDVRNNQLSLVPPPHLCWLEEGWEGRGWGALRGTLGHDPHSLHKYHFMKRHGSIRLGWTCSPVLRLLASYWAQGPKWTNKEFPIIGGNKEKQRWCSLRKWPVQSTGGPVADVNWLWVRRDP